ncbi:unnamed protein product [Cylindrotheca closterium]|uniref:Bromo domain-containing protein n=1 Tax=Cylindrotheca closterium TaxID=2856 RepID=A0AAD2FF30_9STRA|nr:unnamed protein product [Cylindrotheca closterium]
MPPAPGQEDAIKRMTKILNNLWSRTDSAPFREPVDWRGLELFDYPKVIKKMMDLGTIKRRLERNQYETAHQVAEDIRLVWHNCMTYNADGSDFWLLAKSYSRRFEDRYRKVKNEFDVGEDLHDEEDESDESSDEGESSKRKSSSSKKSKEPTDENESTRSGKRDTSLDSRARFGSNIFLLNGIELGHVVTTLELECPNALIEDGSTQMEINLDAIPQEVFERLSGFIESKIGKRSLLDINHEDDESEERIPKKKKKKS